MTLSGYTRFIVKYARLARFESGSYNRKSKKFAKFREVIEKDLRALLGEKEVKILEERFINAMSTYFGERVLAGYS